MTNFEVDRTVDVTQDNQESVALAILTELYVHPERALKSLNDHSDMLCPVLAEVGGPRDFIWFEEHVLEIVNEYYKGSKR